MQHRSAVPSYEHDRILAATEIEAVPDAPATESSPDLYFEDLIWHYYEDAQRADRLLKAAEDEYYPPQPPSPTEYYDNSPSYESDGDSDLVRLAEQEQGDSLLLPGSLSPTSYYEESMRSAMANKPTMNQAHESNLGRQAPFIEDYDFHSQNLRRRKRDNYEHREEHRGDDRIDYQNNGELSEDLQENVSKPVAATTSQGSSATLGTEDSTIVPSLSGENEDIFTRMVELVIDGKKAIVHEHLLCEISRFFERSCRQNTTQTPLSLSVRDYASEIDWDTLMVFVNWVNFNELYDNVSFTDGPPNWNDLLNLYFIADKWEIIVLKNLLLDVLVRQFEWAIETDDYPCYCTKKIWSNTAPGASLRRLWIDFYKWGISGTDFQGEMESDALDLDFLKELSLSLIDSRKEVCDGEENWYLVHPSVYHVADDITGTCCCRVRFEGNEHRHKFQYQRARDHQQWRRQLNGLKDQAKATEKDVEGPQPIFEARKRKADKDWPRGR